MRFLLLAAYLTVSSACFSQDTLRSLSLETFLAHVKENHPVALIASNAVLEAQQIVRLSKGAFDPAVFAGIDQKYFNGTTYYSTIATGIKIPTRLGIDLKAAADWNGGDYLNPQSRVPADGLTYLGIEVPIGRGLFTDERRTQLKRAEVALQQSGTERQLTLNNLLYEAGLQFLVWQEQQAQLALAREGLELARLRLDQVRVGAETGDRPSIDTLEALAQFVNRKIDVDQRMLDEANARLGVQQYLWERGIVPLELELYVAADALRPAQPRLITTDSVATHPWLSWYDLKVNDLKLEKKLKTELLKPQLNFNYNLLQSPSDLVSANYSFTNYKWGASFYIPVLLRKERASLEVTRLKIASTLFEQQLKAREISTKILQVTNDWSARWAQCQSARQVSQHYYSLTLAERSLFELGESSLFLVNTREMSYLGAQSKYLEYAAKTQKSAFEAIYSLGMLGR
jgi:hypothetical protein